MVHGKRRTYKGGCVNAEIGVSRYLAIMDDRPADHGYIPVYKKHTIKTPGRVPGFFYVSEPIEKNAGNGPQNACSAAA